ncbi:hypothetical protein PFICI_12022 [Pestalotiopsis fici W106-1]|uniref:Uncharacterized protein n=1 Tax=Pestalotiopsis fici (strain W106-1 / CGMCC3.15140) TaxID=1229662 RepID=W3WS02_PESFW|nr:uncharacterized protein PFICI_12022 [Pestalotiopsis fici W106-1]ETS76635.1 hypothetical protein PFICI_12022 [Pestalotiopsis fici W106-1]
MFACSGRDIDGYAPPGHSHGAHVTVFSNLVEIREELEQADEECFGWAMAKHALGYMTLEEYFDRLIDHIRKDGVRHTWDKSRSNIAHVLQADLIGGAFKSRMLKRNLGKLSHADGEQLKALCLLFYNEADVAQLQSRISLEVSVTLGSLSPWMVDILAMIAYARRHVDVLEYLVKHHRASSTRAKTTFDLIGTAILSSRQGTSTIFQHSPNTLHNRELEWRFWTALLNAEPGAWLHYPLSETKDAAGLPAGLYYGLHWLADYWAKDHELRASPACAEYLRALSARGVVLGAVTMSRFLSVTEGTSFNFAKDGPFIPVDAVSARILLDCFPLGYSLSNDYPGGDSSMLALPITQWPTNNADRLVVMEMLLEQGLVVDGKIADYGWGSTTGRAEEQVQDTCLIKAAERADTDMVNLLLKHGAQRGIQGAHGHTAAQRARSKGHRKMANYLETL